MKILSRLICYIRKVVLQNHRTGEVGKGPQGSSGPASLFKWGSPRAHGTGLYPHGF